MDTAFSRVYRCRSRDDRWSFDIPEGGAVIVGRSPESADVVIPFPALARQDSRFRNESGVLTVESMGRRGCLWINGEPLRESVSPPLLPGDEVLMLSEVVFVVGVADTQS